MKHFATAILLSMGTFLSAQTKVIGSTIPVTAVAKAVLNGIPGYNVEVLLPSVAGCPHDYSLSPADMKRLTGAKIVVINGGGMEGFLDGVIERVCPGAVIVDASEGILPKGHKHVCGKEHCNHHHHHAVNEHILASPAMMAKAVKSVGSQFQALPELKKYAGKVAENTERFAGELEKTADDYAAFAEALPPSEKNVLIQHSLFEYLAEEAGFHVRGEIFEHDLQEPSASDAAKIIRQIRKEKIYAIFAEPGKSSKMTEMIARESKIPVIYLEANPKEDSPEGILQMFRNDLKILKETVDSK